MKVIDIVILVPLLWGAYRGYTKGFIIELATLLSLVLAIFFGFQLMDVAIGYLQDLVDVPEGLLPYVAFILIFVAILFLVSWIAKWLKKVVHFTILGHFDNIAGAIFGMLKFGFIISIVLWLSEQTMFIIPDQLTEDTVVFPIMTEYSPLLIEQLTTVFPGTKDLVFSINKLITF